MIISFSIANFRSFDNEETFSLAASGRIDGEHEDHVVTIKGLSERLLRTAVLYGANGAGKSNLFAALQYFKSLVVDSQEKSKGTARTPFRLGGQDKQNLPTCFDLQFVLGARVYRLGMKLDSDKIVEEWLVELKGKKERTIYERITASDLEVTVQLAGLKNASSKLKSLADVGGLGNQSFLATAYELLSEEDLGPELLSIVKWFSENLILIGPEEPFTPIASELNHDEDFRQFASEFIRGASTGVESVEVKRQEITETEMKGSMSNSAYRRIQKLVEEREGIGAVIGHGDGNEFYIEHKDGIHYHSLAVEAVHTNGSGIRINFPLAEESDGTRRLLNLLPALQRLRMKDAVFVIDEIDRSLHPLLVRKFLEFFLHSCTGKQHQLVITTHESSLLDLSLIRRDEIWFAEKDAQSATHLYSLDDFKIRTDLKIRKHYLEGRFGAIPFIGSLDALISSSIKKTEATGELHGADV